MARSTTVFLSSTAKDLQRYRDAVHAAILGMDGYHCLRMEDFGARDWESDEFCREKVAECDVFVGLIGHLNGSTPRGKKRSYTEREYEAAKASGKPRLLFLAADDLPVPAALLLGESEAARRRQKTFRRRVKTDRLDGWFSDPAQLGTAVVNALRNLEQERARRAKKPATAVSRTRSGRIKADLALTETTYVEYLADRYRYLDFRGMGFSDRVPLKLPLVEMYVPLKARVEAPEGETWAREMRLAGRRVTAEEAAAIGERVSEPRPVAELLGKSTGLVVLGDPGAGKTTLLKYLAVAAAAGKGVALGVGKRLPLLVPLSAYANALAKADLPLKDFLPRYFKERGLDLPLLTLIDEKLARGDLLLLLDGLDEVRDLAQRRVMVERLQDFHDRHRKAGNQLVLTSRVVGYREVRLAAEGVVEATLVDFDDEEISAFVEKWTAAVEKAAAGEGRLAKEGAERERRDLLEAVSVNPGVRSLAANPLLLTILALMKRQGVTLPERRVELYEKYVETLVKHWNLARSLAGRPTCDLDLLDTLRILRPLALWMHETSPGVGLVKEGDLHRELERILAARGEKDLERAADRFLADVREHTSLLLDRGGRQYGFIHLTFQEYLAAAALAQRGQQGVGPIVEALALHVGEAPWHEVILLTVGYLGLVQQRDEAAGALVEELLTKSPGPPGEAAVLVGRAVADMGASGVPPACREKVVTELLGALRNDQGVERERRIAAGRALAGVGDPRPEVMRVDGMELCLVPAGPFWMGSEELDDEKPQHELDLPYDFLIGRYPVTVAQLREHAIDVVQGSLAERLEGQPANAPATQVTWYEALGFCEWLSRRWRDAGRMPKGWEAGLPSEAEWEKAARGGVMIPSHPLLGTRGRLPPQPKPAPNPLPRRRFPWGDEADPNRASYEMDFSSGASTVGCFPGGASPYGCEELSGNVWEWTRSSWGEDIAKPRFRYPYLVGDGRENLEASVRDLRVLRGGAFDYDSRNVRCAVRFRFNPDVWNDVIGFRVVLSPFRSGL